MMLEFSQHALNVKNDGTIHFIKKIKDFDYRYLRIVVNIQSNKIVTLFFDRRLKEKNYENKS